ncbi:MFS transporter [Methanocella sp. CWC-04]|uniref:MFS transporter n=1 Tax=Methanooceanicella nereidis TaxID=2052831 RepID=A0AAP2RCM1_9EURY|nr:MFS transporter [Methanocella sp. CWC-04]MCD1295081.1 MFS transporter [Methanocella sp. CWC-04]
MSEKIDKRIIIIITGLASFITPFLSSSVNVALPVMGSEFSADAILLGWVVTSYLLSAAIFIVPFGKIADMYGRRIVFISGLAIIAISTLLAALSYSALMLIACRILQGIGSAMIFGTSVAILTASFPLKERGKVLGINVGIVYSGLSLGPFLGGIITQYAGWRYIFILNVLICMVSLLLALRRLKEDWHAERSGRFDTAGCVLYGVMLFALMYGLSVLPDISGAYWLLAGLVGMIIFAWWELRNSNPVLNIRIFRNNITFTFSNMAALINYSATFAISFLLSLYLQYIQGLSPQIAGLVLISSPVVQAILSPAAGKLSDRIEPRIVASTGMGITAAGLFLFMFLNESTPLVFIVAILMLMGLGFALFSSPNMNAIMSSVDKRDYGVASGMVSTMRLTGQMMSLGIAMLTMSVFIGRVQITPDMHGQLMSSITASFSIFAVLCVAGLIASLMRGKLRPEQPPVILQRT